MDKIEVTQADRTLYHQLLSLGSVNLNRRRMGLPIVDGFELIAAHRLATRTDATPVAWMYEREDGSKDLVLDCNGEYARRLIELGATETALYPDPPATDVAALVEAAKETNAALERDGDPAFAHLILANKAALAPFTKGQNDE